MDVGGNRSVEPVPEANGIKGDAHQQPLDAEDWPAIAGIVDRKGSINSQLPLCLFGC